MILDRIASGRGRTSDIDLLLDVCDNISPGLAWPPKMTTICPLGPSAVSPITSLMGSGMGPNIGGAVFVAFISAIYKRHLKPGLSILGDLSISGSIGRVDNFSDKLAMLSENGSLMVLSPMENLNELQNIPPSVLNNTDVSFYSDSQMLLQKSILNE